MCARCDGFSERRRVNSGYEYRDLVRQIMETIEQGTFRLLSGTCKLEDILTARQWPGDYIVHVLECTTCSRRFQLSVETYHGSGGAWQVIVSSAWTDALVAECNGDTTPTSLGLWMGIRQLHSSGNARDDWTRSYRLLSASPATPNCSRKPEKQCNETAESAF